MADVAILLVLVLSCVDIDVANIDVVEDTILAEEEEDEDELEGCDAPDESASTRLK